MSVFKTPSFQKLRQLWHAKAKASGFRDIEYLDKATGEAGDMLLGVNTAQLMAMGGPSPDLPGSFGGGKFEESIVDRRQNDRTRAALTAIDGWEGWFDLLRDNIPNVRRRWPRQTWRIRAFELYAEGMSLSHITPLLNKTRTGGNAKLRHVAVRHHIFNELAHIRDAMRERWTAAKARIREDREAGVYDVE